jgi:hypothetical protein
VRPVLKRSQRRIMSAFPNDFYHLLRMADRVARVLSNHKGYLFNTPYRWGRPVEYKWVVIAEPWSTHWTSVGLDRDRGNPLYLTSHVFYIREPPELMPPNDILFPHEDFPGYWKGPHLGLTYYVSAKVKVIGSESYCECWFELTDEEEERRWDLYEYNVRVYKKIG